MSTPKPLASASQGNVQVLEDGNMLIGWGAEPYFSEYTASGSLVFDAHLPAKTQSYRSLSLPVDRHTERRPLGRRQPQQRHEP